MDASLVAGFVALGVCLVLAFVGFFFRFMMMRDLWSRGSQPREKRPKLPPRDPYHIP